MTEADLILATSLKIAKDNIDMNLPNLRDVSANSVQALVQMYEAYGRIVVSMDGIIREVGGSTCDRDLLMKFIKHRDLVRDFVSIMRIKQHFDKEFLELLDKMLFFFHE